VTLGETKVQLDTMAWTVSTARARHNSAHRKWRHSDVIFSSPARHLVKKSRPRPRLVSGSAHLVHII